MGCAIGGRGEEDALFKVRKKEVQFERIPADKAAGVFGVAEIGFSRSD
jgi:hypothetical protein